MAEYKDTWIIDLDIWRSANIMLKRYGGEAVFIASKRAGALLDQGDVQGCSALVRIAKAIAELERKATSKGDRGTSTAASAHARRAEPLGASLALVELFEVPALGCCAARAVHHPVNPLCTKCGHRGGLLQVPSHHSLETAQLPFPAGHAIRGTKIGPR